MRALFLMVVLTLGTVGCKKLGSTPEDAFMHFSMASAMGQPPGMERYGEKDYAFELQNSYDGLALMSAFWPKNPTIVKSTTENDVVTLQIQGLNAIGKTIDGTFKLRRHGDVWKVFEGDWNHRTGESMGTGTAPEATSESFTPAVEVAEP